jgi:hypothetical protein
MIRQMTLKYGRNQNSTPMGVRYQQKIDEPNKMEDIFQ